MSNYNNRTVEEIQEELDEAIAGRLPYELDQIKMKKHDEDTCKEPILVLSAIGFFGAATLATIVIGVYWLSKVILL